MSGELSHQRSTCSEGGGKQSEAKRGQLETQRVDETRAVRYQFLFVAEAVLSLSVRQDGYFSFRKGQKFDILEETACPGIGSSDSQEKDLYIARDDNGAIGFVEKRYFLRCEDKKPILCSKSWYHGGISKEESRRRLRNQAPGCFLIRDSVTRTGSFDIACKTLGDVIFVHVVSHSSGYFCLNKRFNALVYIIEHYHKIPITGNQYLTYPVVP